MSSFAFCACTNERNAFLPLPQASNPSESDSSSATGRISSLVYGKGRENIPDIPQVHHCSVSTRSSSAYKTPEENITAI